MNKQKEDSLKLQECRQTRRKKSAINYQTKLTQMKQMQMMADLSKFEGSNLGMYTQQYNIQKEVDKFNKKRKKKVETNWPTKLSYAYEQSETPIIKNLSMPKQKRRRHQNSKLQSQDFIKDPIQLNQFNINP
jgi:hypothetical protein